MANDPIANEDPFKNMIGTENDLNHIMSNFVDSEDEIMNFCESRYIDMCDIESAFRSNQNEFAVLSLNIQSIKAKFDNFFAIINRLSSLGIFFGAICLQETWLTANADLSLLQMPGYKLIHQGHICSKHGGLLIYLNNDFRYDQRTLYKHSDIWEGLFIDVSGPSLNRPLTIGNIYRPPHDNNNNENISKFIAELSPIIDLLQSENKYATVVGDFNINLLQINEREKYSEFFDMMCTNSFFPKITLPTHYGTHSCSLIDQMFCKVPHKQEIDISSSIIISRISDHFPCIVNLRTPGEGRKQEKLIYTRTINDSAINDFREELSRLDIPSRLNANLLSDPNIDYGKFEEVLCVCFNKHFPEKRIKVNKYKHKLSPWITSGIIKSIEFRDNLYKKLKACTTDSPEYELNQYNLKIYNGYLRQCIRAAKKQHYTHEFAKYKNNIRKTWDTLKDIMNKKKSKVEFPTYFLNNGKYVCGAKNIADKFNEYFTEIGPSLASEIDVSNKSPFNTYLTSPCTSSFYFQYTNPSGILKIIQGLKPKTSAGYDHLSSKVLKDIADIVSTPLSIIINQSLCSGIFPSKLKIAKVIPLFKKGDIQLFGNYRPISLLSSVSKVFEKAAYGQLYEYFSSHALFYDSQYGFRKYHSTELAALELVDRIHKEIDEN